MTGNRNDRPRMGGGAPLAFSIIGGVVIGGMMGQPSAGLVIGLGIGVLIALAIWWVGRDRQD